MPGFSFENKVAILTGSSMGIGKAMAWELAKQGAKIVINGRNEGRLFQARDLLESAGADVLAIPGDVTNLEDCKKIVDGTIARFGKIDLLINNAGTSMRGNFADLEPAVFKTIMDLNYLGAVYPTKIALPFLLESKGGIMFVSSVVGIRGLQSVSAYCAAKMSLTAIVESLKIELAGTGMYVGITYVGLTQNDPEKRIIGADGQQMPLTERSNGNAWTTGKTAKSILQNIQKRRFKTVLTTLGKINAITNLLFPRLIDRILIRANKKFQELSK